jgi:serine/threonine protein kinase
MAVCDAPDDVMSDDAHEFHDRVTDAFTRALETPPPAREAFVASVRRDDPTVAVELERWLAARGPALDEGPGPFLEEPIVRLSALQAESAPSRSPSLAPGGAIGPYRVIRSLGRGAFSEVFLGEQRSPVQRRVAIKLLTVGMAPPDVLRRFERERQALARLQHPSIARLFEVGLHEGSPYFVMEWIDGRPLTRFAADRQLGASERLSLMRQLARTVQYAHEQGLVHRDLKPSNVLAFDGPDGPTVSIIDFGVAKALSADPLPGWDDATLNTALGVIIGTPPYMSPELLDGDPAAASTRSDVYALGAILFELMAGERLITASPIAVVRRLAHAGPARALERLATGDACRLPASRSWRRDLSAIIETASHPERARRYASAAEFADDLDQLAHGEAVRARRASGWESTRRWARRHPVLVVAAIGAFVAALGGTAILNERLRNAELRSRLLATALAAATSAEGLADRVGVDRERARLNETTLLAARELSRLDPDDPVALDLLARGLQGAQEWLFTQSDLVAGDERARLRAASYDMRRELLEVRERIAARPGASIADRAAVGTALVLIGNGHQAEGRYDLAEPLYRRTLELEESLLAEAPDDPLLLSRLSYSCERLCVRATERHDDDEAIRLATRRLELAERLESLLPADRYAALNVAEARRFVLAMPDTDPFNDVTRDRFDEICARHVAFCRTLLDRFPGCKRSVRELAMALATAARRLPESEQMQTRMGYLNEAATLMRRVLADQPDDQMLLDPLASVLSDLSQEAEWSGDIPTALERLDEQIAIMRELRSRRPEDQVYIDAMARAEARLRHLRQASETP